MTDTPQITINQDSRQDGTPILWLRDPVVFPYSLAPVLIDESGRAALDLAMKTDRLLAIFPQLPSKEEMEHRQYNCRFEAFDYENQPRSAHGVLTRVVKVLNFPDGTTQILLRGLKRISFRKLGFFNTVACALYDEQAAPTPEEREEFSGLINALNRMFGEFSSLQPAVPDELKVALFNTRDPERAVDLLADNLGFDYVEKLLLLTTPSLADRSEFLLMLLNRELEVSKVGMKIQSDVHMAMSQSQREYFLREQLNTIRQELGEECRNPDIVEIEKRLAAKELPDRAREVVQKELARLEIIPQAAPEYHISYTYINWILDLPWSEYTEDKLDVAAAAKILDADHYGLEDVKERILEFLAVLQLQQNRKAPILCLVGPPGVGKTSLGQSIARALGRKFVRIALGGVHDEAEIRGHRRTYVGAMPGRIIQGMKKAESANPVFLLDEIDKLAHDMRGDPASALLEVLDPEQNVAFNDHYLELDYDLSKVFFLATANMLDTIPTPLLDRMEVIRLPGYTSFEKREIAKRYLVPRQMAAAGIKGKNLRFQLSAIDEIIDYYTREAGVRQLERTIAQVCRKLARRVVEGKLDTTKVQSVNAALVRELLGTRLYLLDEAEKAPEPGVATGMAWTSYGGTILPVEVIAVPGKGELKLTGSLGKVMQESAEAAFSFIRSRAAAWHIAPEEFEKKNFHIHVPDGATPKDGPSAGITLATALVSLLTGRSLRPALAMTGEITLRGKVTAIGGVREKTIAALRSGIKVVIMPEENRKDAAELPEEISKQLEIHFVSRFEEVMKLALLPSTTGKNRKKS